MPYVDRLLEELRQSYPTMDMRDKIEELDLEEFQ